MYRSFETERLLFVPLSIDHLAGYHTISSDELACRYGLRGALKTIEESKERLSKVSTTSENPHLVNYAIFLRSTPDLPAESTAPMIAEFGCHIVKPEKKLAMLAYRFLPQYWRKGYGSEALKAFLPVFWELSPDVEKLEAIVDIENVPSQKLLLKNGFRSIEHDLTGVVLPLVGPEVRPSPLIFQMKRNLEESESKEKWVMWFN
ncbi:GNAT domain-containing protein [Flagelloscypha sp. PMI_526]|nr:GNAT domain-containing protein [Flagelloscypha sp. PMI_526]